MKPSGLSKVCIFSVSGNRERQSKHPSLKCSLVRPTASERSKEVWLSSLGLKKWISGP